MFDHHKLGEGSFGCVYLAHDDTRNTAVAVKAILKNSKQKPEDVLREIEAGKRLEHKNLVRLLDSYEDDQYWYLMMEYIEGENLFDFVERNMQKNEGELKLSQTFVRKLFKQLVSAIDYSHKSGVIHLDLKLENIMIHEKNVKIIDFGLCDITSDVTQLCTKFAGSLDYLAPEIIKRRPYRGDKADVWSLGVILYILLNGEMPYGRDDRLSFADNRTEHPEIIWENKRRMSRQAQDLLKHMLEIDPRERYTISQVKKHPWFSSVWPL